MHPFGALRWPREGDASPLQLSVGACPVLVPCCCCQQCFGQRNKHQQQPSPSGLTAHGAGEKRGGPRELANSLKVWGANLMGPLVE